MKLRNIMIGASFFAVLMSPQNAEAQSGKPYIHDPSHWLNVTVSITPLVRDEEV